MNGPIYVVTGGAGAIGSRVVRRLLTEHNAAFIYVIDDFSSGHPWLVPDDPRVAVRNVDVADLRALPEGAVVVHLAAHFANQNSVDHPFADLDTNGLGTLRVLDAAARAHAEHVIFASAGCAAGHEDTPYQIHKSLGEAYCRYYADRVPTTVCRFHNSYGPGEVPGKYRNVIPNFLWAALHDEPLTIFGDGRQERDFVFVEDLATEMLHAAPGAQPIEIGSGCATRILDLAKMILELTRSRSKIVFGPERRWDHPGRHARHVRPNATPLEAGLYKTILWFNENAAEIERSLR